MLLRVVRLAYACLGKFEALWEFLGLMQPVSHVASFALRAPLGEEFSNALVSLRWTCDEQQTAFSVSFVMLLFTSADSEADASQIY